MQMFAIEKIQLEEILKLCYLIKSIIKVTKLSALYCSLFIVMHNLLSNLLNCKRCMSNDHKYKT